MLNFHTVKDIFIFEEIFELTQNYKLLSEILLYERLNIEVTIIPIRENILEYRHRPKIEY